MVAQWRMTGDTNWNTTDCQPINASIMAGSAYRLYGCPLAWCDADGNIQSPWSATQVVVVS